MTKPMETKMRTILTVDDDNYGIDEVVSALRLANLLPKLIEELLMGKIIDKIQLDQGKEENIVEEFRRTNGLEQEESFINFLDLNNLNMELLSAKISRPSKIVKFREEKWGPRANALYLKNKDSYDKITYRRLQSKDQNVMQEVFFRLKDKEDSWESMAKQFPQARPGDNGRIGPVPTKKVEAELLAALREAGPKKIIKPLIIGGITIVAELEKIEGTQFDDELRSQILREQFEQWITEECNNMIKKLKVSE